MKYSYYTKYRPPSPYCQPHKGLIETVDFGDRIQGNVADLIILMADLVCNIANNQNIDVEIFTKTVLVPAILEYSEQEGVEK